MVHLQNLLNQGILRDAVLNQVAVGSLLESLLRIGETLVAAQDDNAAGQLVLTDPADEFETVHPAHLDVRDHNIHRRPFQELQGFPGGTEYTGYFNIFFPVNEGLDADAGEDFVIQAFRFARKYADPEVKLFYNDYNEYMPAKREMITATVKKLKEKGVLDGVGMQSHWDMDYPTTDLIDAALEKYGDIEGLEIQLTEIDMHNTDASEEGLKAQADRYKEFFQTILRADRTGKANITNVTFWGVTDEDSWLTNFKGETSYPLLFQGEMEKKPCYDSILEAAGESY